MHIGTWGATSTEVRESEQSVLHLPREVRGSWITTTFYQDHIAVVGALASRVHTLFCKTLGVLSHGVLQNTGVT